MNKKHLFIASALLSVLVIAGAAEAKTDTGTTLAAKTTEVSTDQMSKPMRGRSMMGKLSEAGQKIMKEAMAKSSEDNKAVMEQIKTKHEELRALLNASSFDKTAYLAKEEEIQTLHHKMMAARAEAKANAAAQMTPEDRAAMGHMRGHRGMMGDKGGKGLGPDGSGCPMVEDMDMGPEKTSMVKESPEKK